MTLSIEANVALTEQLLRRAYEEARDTKSAIDEMRGWTLQGLGMLRHYVAPDRSLRLHIWDSRFKVTDASEMHTHPWSMRSTIIAGGLRNQRFEQPYGPTDQLFAEEYRRQTILCGEGGGLEGEPELVELVPQTEERYTAGDTYYQHPPEIHVSKPLDGTVTLVERKFGEDVDHAYVYWRPWNEWVSAEPRTATAAEVASIIGASLDRWFGGRT